MLQLSNAYFSPSFRRITLTNIFFFSATLAKPSPSDASSRRHHAIAAAKMYLNMDVPVRCRMKVVLAAQSEKCPELTRFDVNNELRRIKKNGTEELIKSVTSMADLPEQREKRAKVTMTEAEAIAAVKAKKMTSASAAKACNVPRTTFIDHKNGLHTKKHGGKEKLPEEVTQHIIDWVRMFLYGNLVP